MRQPTCERYWNFMYENTETKWDEIDFKDNVYNQVVKRKLISIIEAIDILNKRVLR